MPHIAFNDIKALKAAALFADKKDIRPPLQGVWVDCLGPHPVLYGTNGHMLGCVRIEAESDPPFAVMLPPAAPVPAPALPACRLATRPGS